MRSRSLNIIDPRIPGWGGVGYSQGEEGQSVMGDFERATSFFNLRIYEVVFLRAG